MCASALCMGALVVGSLNLWASEPMSEGQIDNAEALEASGGPTVNCADGSGLCKATCSDCGLKVENTDGGTVLHVKGKCPNCAGTNFWFL